MKVIHGQKTVTIPEGVTATVDRRVVTVEGPRGKLVRSFKHIPSEIMYNDEAKQVGIPRRVEWLLLWGEC